MLVLIVDADPDRRRGADRLVQKTGAVAVTATDPRTAMLLFVRRGPAVTVLQVDASAACDLGLCRDMKALRAGRRRAVVVVAPQESRAAAFESGCDAFITQGTDPLPLQRAVQRLLTAARTSDPEVEVVA